MIHQINKYGDNRNTQEHAHNAACSAAYCDGKNNPDRRKSCGISENLRTEDGSVKLLQQENKNQEN